MKCLVGFSNHPKITWTQNSADIRIIRIFAIGFSRGEALIVSGVVENIGVNPLVSMLFGHPQFLCCKGEKEGVGERGKERGNGGRKRDTG